MPDTHAAETPGSAAGRRQLQLDQQHDALRLDLQHALGARRSGLSPGDARRLEQLHMQQRLQQQLLESEQVQRERQTRRAAPEDARALNQRLGLQRDAFALERDLQLQQFDLEQRRLMQSRPREPLQPPVGNPQLRLP
jgi:hypothetical protein